MRWKSGAPGATASRALKNSFNPLLVPGHGRPGEIMHSLVCLISGAQRKPRFSQATLEKSKEGFFQQPARALMSVAVAAILTLARPCSAEDLAELDDAASRLQYAAHTGDTRALEEVVGLVAKLDTSEANAALREYYLGYGNWQLAHLYTDERRAGTRKSGDRDAARALQDCTRHVQAAVRLDARMAEAYAIEAICSGGMPQEGDARGRGASCAQHRGLRTARELDADNPRIRLIEVLCASPRGSMSTATFEKLRTLVTAFEAAPPTRAGQPDWGYAEALVLLGEGLLQRGDNVAARDALERALVTAPDYRAAQQLLQAAASRPK